jgi:hypothetical protein
LDAGIELTLWGNMPEATLDYYYPVLESRVIVHENQQLDADLTLERGRIILRNKKTDGKDAVIRVRFSNDSPDPTKDEFFDITLHSANAALVLDRFCKLDVPFFEDPKDTNRVGAMVFMNVFALESSATVRFGQPSELVDAQKPMLQWSSRSGGLGVPADPDTKPPLCLKGMPAVQDKAGRDKAYAAHVALAKTISEAKPIDVAIEELLQLVQKEKLSADTFALWRHAIRSMAAVDELARIYDEFSQERTPLFVRGVCLQQITQWLAWDRDNDYQFRDLMLKFNNKNKTVCNKIVELFHPVSAKDADDPMTYQLLIEGLDNDLLAIRTLSHWNLLILARSRPGGEIFYDPAMPRRDRLAAIARWRAFIPPGRLPLQAVPPAKTK